MKYIFSFLFIFSFVLIHTLLYIIITIYYNKFLQKAETILVMGFTSKFMMNYQIYKLEFLLKQNTYINSKEIIQLDYGNIFNVTAFHFNLFANKIDSNKNLFMNNFTDIMVHDLCSLFTLKICDKDELKYTQNNGMRSLVSFYFKTIIEAYIYYENNYKKISDIREIISNDKGALGRMLIEDIFVLYDEIYYQFNETVNKRLNTVMIEGICIGVALSALFLISLTIRGGTFIKRITQEEVMCNQGVTELPYDIGQGNSEMQHILAGTLVNNHKKNI